MGLSLRARLALLIVIAALPAVLLAARIFSVADVYDALSSDRPYRAAWQEPRVLTYIRDESGRLFDPRIVEAFFSLLADEIPAGIP